MIISEKKEVIINDFFCRVRDSFVSHIVSMLILCAFIITSLKLSKCTKYKLGVFFFFFSYYYFQPERSQTPQTLKQFIVIPEYNFICLHLIFWALFVFLIGAWIVFFSAYNYYDKTIKTQTMAWVLLLQIKIYELNRLSKINFFLIVS